MCEEEGLSSFSLTSDYCNSCQVSKRLNFAQCTSCYPNEEYAGDDYDEEDDLFEDSLDESNDEHSLSADDKKPNEQLEELQADSLRERIVPLTRGQRRVEARRKKMKKNNGDDGVNSVTDEVRYCIIYVHYITESNITNGVIFQLTCMIGFRCFQWSYFL